ncbi:uncharacterized protein LOC141591729 isoform X1 [Silene latifolia]|uniref:uncharacterized protein LOC141591729 isoform X1 n=1 Tax=Silene latifolia TaxID=37657 RepID=UPI003D77DB4F
MSIIFNLLSKSIKPTKIPKFLGTISLTFSTISSHKCPIFSTPSINPPIPKKLPFKLNVHGCVWDDPYHWMSNINDPDFSSYLQLENSYADAFMADTVKLQKDLFFEMGSRLPSKIQTPPERWGPWLYYQYIPEGKEYPVLCRRLATEGSAGLGSLFSLIKKAFRKEEMLLDWNEIAEKYGYVHVGTCRISHDHNFLAYTLDINGSECFFLQIKDLRDGHVLSDIKADSVVSLAWSQDSSVIFYTVCDDNQRPYRVHCKNLGSDVDTVIFTEDDSRFCVDITSTKDGKFITINSNSRTSSEVFVLDAISPLNSLRRVHKRIDGVQFFLEHHQGFFYVLTNNPSTEVGMLPRENFYMGICRVEDIDSKNWQSIILPSEGTNLQDMDMFDKYLVLFLEREGSSVMCSINLPIVAKCKNVMEIKHLNPWIFPVPSDVCRTAPGSNHDYLTSAYRAVLSSPVMPDLVVEYDMSKRTFSVIHQEEVVQATRNVHTNTRNHEINGKLPKVENDKHRHDQSFEGLQSWKDFSSSYACETHEVVSHDGTKVPLTIVYSKDRKPKEQFPGLLEAYGAYGEVLEKCWCADRLSLLERGWVLAFADVRGGGGSDPSWHQQGSRANKMNSVYDYVFCAKYLVNKGYARKDRLAAIGYSAGSLLVGAAINSHPALFSAAILKVPFLDICNTLMDESLPLTILDHEEFGNPKIKAEFESLMKYSPYDNINQGSCYPAMLVTAAFNDTRVGVWEAAKWVAKVRETTCTTCSRSVILKTEMKGGHFGEGGRSGHSKEKAYEYAFLLKVMGLLDSSRH